MPDWIPQQDDAFFALANKFVPPIVATPAAFGLETADGTALHDAFYTYTIKRAARVSADGVAATALVVEHAAQDALTVLLRADGKFIQARPATTDEQRSTVGLPIHKTTQTPVPAPTVAPELIIKAGAALETIWSWRSAATPGSKARPPGVRTTELRMQVGGTPPTDPETMTDLGNINNSPNTEHHDVAQGGQLVYGIGRYISTRGEPGPWGNVATGTIPHL